MKTTKNKHGFTLIETMFATLLLGLVIASLVAASGAFTMANGYGVDLSTAEFLIEEVRGYSAKQSFDELLADVNYDTGTPFGPIDIAGNTIAGFGEFAQQVDIDFVDSGNFTNVVTGPTDFVRITVTVTKNGRPISSSSWIRTQLGG